MTCDVRRHATTAPSVLVARPDHLGDLLLTLPAIDALKRRVPAAAVTAMVPANLVPIAERATVVDEVLAAPFDIADPAPPPDTPDVAALAGRLSGRFDLALLPRPRDPWSGAVVARAAIPIRIGHAQPATIPFLTHAVPERTGRHITHEATVLALHAARLLRGRERGTPPRGNLLALRAEDHSSADGVLAEYHLIGTRPIIVHPAAAWPLKSWPIGRWSSVVRAITRRLRATVLLAGQGHDRTVLEEIAWRSGCDPRIVDSVGIGTLAALHQRARVVIGIDSGALHLAAAVGAPLIGLFGPFGPQRARPLAPPERSMTLFHPLPCSPCGTLEHPPCGALRNPACLAAITVDEVVEAAARIAGRPPIEREALRRAYSVTA